MAHNLIGFYTTNGSLVNRKNSAGPPEEVRAERLEPAEHDHPAGRRRAVQVLPDGAVVRGAVHFGHSGSGCIYRQTPLPGEMGTLVHPVLRAAWALGLVASALWTAFFVFDRLYALHSILGEQRARLADEAWLRRNCADPVFFSNLRGHTDVCDQVAQNARRNVWLYTLRRVTEEASLCGARPCESYAAEALAWLYGLSAWLLGLCAAAACAALLLTVRLVHYLEVLCSPHHSGYVPPLAPRERRALNYYPLDTDIAVKEL